MNGDWFTPWHDDKGRELYWDARCEIRAAKEIEKIGKAFGRIARMASDTAARAVSAYVKTLRVELEVGRKGLTVVLWPGDYKDGEFEMEFHEMSFKPLDHVLLRTVKVSHDFPADLGEKDEGECGADLHLRRLEYLESAAKKSFERARKKLLEDREAHLKDAEEAQRIIQDG